MTEETELGSAVHHAFEKLRPLCVELTKDPNRENIAKLEDVLGSLDIAAMQQLQEYVLFPLRLILKQSQSRSRELYIDVLKCMHTALSRSEVTRPEMFRDIFNSLCLMISSPDLENKVLDLPEEMKLEVVRCLSALAGRASTRVLQAIYTPVFVPPLGHAVSVLLHLVANEQLRQLRIESLHCLVHLAQVDRKMTTPFKVTTGNMFAYFLPGIVTTVAKIITGDAKQGQAVTVAALEAWHKIVCLVMADAYLEMAMDSEPLGKNEPELDARYHSLVVQRSPEWVIATGAKLKVLVEKIATMVTHSNWKVRQGLVAWAKNLLLCCTKSLQSCVPDLLQVLVTLVGDEYPNVAGKCKAALQDFQEHHLQEGAKSLVEVLEENLHGLATRLPRLMRSTDDAEKLTTLNLFCGYLKLLGPQINGLLHSYSHLQRVFLALVQVLELDCSHIKVIQEKTPDAAATSLGVEATLVKPRKYFRHFVDQRIQDQLIIVCRLIGYYGNIQLLLDHVLDLFHQSTLYRKQAALILNELILGISQLGLDVDIASTQKRDLSLLRSFLGNLIQDYLSPEYFDLPTSIQSESSGAQSGPTDWLIVPASRNPSSFEHLNSNALQIYLLLEGIGNCAKVLGAEGFQYSLMYVLYPVLEKLGSETAIVTQVAYLTLQDICVACKYNSIEDLLCQNADYLVNSISLKLRHLRRHPRSPQVLQVLVAHSGQEILPLVDSTVYEVLSSLDHHYGDKATQFMSVLKTLVSAIRKWYSREDEKEQKDIAQGAEALDGIEQQGQGQAAAHRIYRFLVEYENQKRIAAGDLSDEEEDSGNLAEDVGKAGNVADDDELYGEKKEPPRHVKIVREIMTRCTQLLSIPDPRLKLLVLDTVCEACLALRGNQEELLPLIHKVWPPFALRISDEEILVRVKMFNTLCTMATISGDFIRRRVVKDVLPKVCSFLSHQAPTRSMQSAHLHFSMKAGPAYKFTTYCKLQLAILQGLGQLCREIDLRGSHMTPAMVSCLPYLSCRQPMALQTACLETFQQFSQIDCDNVWLTVSGLYSHEPLKKPLHPALKELKEFGPTNRNEYSNNVTIVLEHI